MFLVRVIGDPISSDFIKSADLFKEFIIGMIGPIGILLLVTFMLLFINDYMQRKE